MLDVFVVAVMIVVAKISKLASAEAHIGIYFFGGSIALAMLATMEMDKLLKKRPTDSPKERLAGLSDVERLLDPPSLSSSDRPQDPSIN